MAKLGQSSHRGEPHVIVIDSNGRRYHLPHWMTVPAAADWTVREFPCLPLAVLRELRDLVTTFPGEPVQPETGGRNEVPEAQNGELWPEVGDGVKG